MKNNTNCLLVFLFVSVLAGCATMMDRMTQPVVGIEIEKDVSLPLTVENIWYRTEKVRLLGLAYEESGTVTVSENSVEFTYEKGSIRIPRENIQKISWGKLSPDIVNHWVIVHYTDSGKGAVAAFKGALFSGGGKESKIYSSILHIMKAR